MSIREEIWNQISEGRLMELRPRAGYPIRQMYIETSLYEEIVAEIDDLKKMDRYTKLEADLAEFITSPTIHPNYLYLLSPTRDNVWEIRSVQPKPQLRVFGMFAAKDCFIATHHEYRDTLGVFDSKSWKTEKRRAIAIWRKLFNSYQPLNSKDVDKLFTGAINGKYFRD